MTIASLTSVTSALGVFVGVALVSATVPSAGELALLGAGVLVERDVVVLWPIVLAALAGVVVGDALLHRAGARGRTLDEARRARAAAIFGRFGDATFLVARIAVGARRDLLIHAGATGRSLRRQVLLDALAGAVHVPLFVTAGAWLGAELERAHLVVDRARLAAILAILALLGAVAWVRRRRARLTPR